MLKAFSLLELLADGETHSGEAIAVNLGVTRAAVWHQIKRLQTAGVDIHAVSGKGYRLPGGFEFLDADAIKRALGDRASQVLRGMHLNRVTDSTNQRLLDSLNEHDVHAVAWLAEYQTAGRGRRGGTWLAPPGSGLCLSIGWRFDVPPATISALSLVVGVAVLRALHRLGAEGVGLKWPNDVLHDERKLAGILIEMRSEFGGPCTVAIGIGINVALSDEARVRINDIATDIRTACGYTPSRNRTAALIIEELFTVLSDFGEVGFSHYRAEWQHFDVLAGREIGLQMAGSTMTGVARGVGPDGTLLIERDGVTTPYFAGHIVMRPRI